MQYIQGLNIRRCSQLGQSDIEFNNIRNSADQVFSARSTCSANRITSRDFASDGIARRPCQLILFASRIGGTSSMNKDSPCRNILPQEQLCAGDVVTEAEQ